MTWTQVYDEASGAHYYYDDETGLTQWEQPDAFESAARPDSIVVDAQTADALRSVQPRGAWTECFDETTGHWFFYNTITGETCWEKPSGFVAGGLVAVIAAKAGYQATAHEPLCAACFDRSTPLRRSKLFWLLALLALAGLLAAFVLSLSPCEEKVALEYREHTTNVTTLAVTRNYTKVYSAGPCANAVSPAAVEIIADGAANQTTVLFNYTLDHKCLLNATSKLDFVDLARGANPPARLLLLPLRLTQGWIAGQNVGGKSRQRQPFVFGLRRTAAATVRRRVVGDRRRESARAVGLAGTDRPGVGRAVLLQPADRGDGVGDPGVGMSNKKYHGTRGTWIMC